MSGPVVLILMGVVCRGKRLTGGYMYASRMDKLGEFLSRLVES